jgi:hypothetical protein
MMATQKRLKFCKLARAATSSLDCTLRIYGHDPYYARLVHKLTHPAYDTRRTADISNARTHTCNGDTVTLPPKRLDAMRRGASPASAVAGVGGESAKNEEQNMTHGTGQVSRRSRALLLEQMHEQGWVIKQSYAGRTKSGTVGAGRQENKEELYTQRRARAATDMGLNSVAAVSGRSCSPPTCSCLNFPRTVGRRQCGADAGHTRRTSRQRAIRSARACPPGGARHCRRRRRWRVADSGEATGSGCRTAESPRNVELSPLQCSPQLSKAHQGISAAHDDARILWVQLLAGAPGGQQPACGRLHKRPADASRR